MIRVFLLIGKQRPGLAKLLVVVVVMVTCAGLTARMTACSRTVMHRTVMHSS